MALRKVPSCDQIPDDASAAVKERAQRAWRDLRKLQGLVPMTIVDRLWANGLSAAEAAPERVRAVMLHHLETTFRLLIDQGRWSRLDPPPAGKVHTGRSSH
jgi:hypothetical protein